MATTVTLTGTYEKPDGTAQSGRVLFLPTAPIQDASGDRIYAGATIAELDANGAFSVELAATNDPTSSPTDNSYTVTEAFNGDRPRSYQIVLDYTDTTQDIADIAPATVTPVYDAATTAALTAGLAGKQPIVDSFIVHSSGLSIALGSPNEGSINRNAGWAMATNEGVGSTVSFPSHWANYDVDIWWSNVSASSGNVSLRFDTLSVGDGDTLSTPTSGSVVTTAAPSQNVTKVTTLASNIAVPAAGKWLSFVVVRSATSDTLGANDIALLGLNFRKR